MRDFRRFVPWLTAVVCLGFTGSRCRMGRIAAFAPRGALRRGPDRAARHQRDDAAARDRGRLRLWRAAGRPRRSARRWRSASAAGGSRSRPSTATSASRSRARRACRSATASGSAWSRRFDVLRLGPRIVGGNSLLSVYVEGGAAVAWNHWYLPAHDEASRVVPDGHQARRGPGRLRRRSSITGCRSRSGSRTASAGSSAGAWRSRRTRPRPPRSAAARAAARRR